MRSCVCVLSLLLGACAVPAGGTAVAAVPGPAVPGPGSAAPRDAAFDRTDATLSIPAQVVAVDPATAELLGAILSTTEQLRRIHLANIANVGTPGWKRCDPEFGSRVIHSDGVALSAPVLLGQRPTMTAGVLFRTDRSLDVGIDGDGMFAVELQGGRVGFTRCGRLQVAADRRLSAGDLPLRPAIVVPVDTVDVRVDAEGAVLGNRADGTGIVAYGWIGLHRFAAAEQLERAGPGVWVPTERSGAPDPGRPGTDGFGTLRQGYLEASNVELDRELLALQAVERGRQRILAVARALGFVAQ